MVSISDHTAFLAKRLHDGMVKLTHTNGERLCMIHTDHSTCAYGDPKTRKSHLLMIDNLESGGVFDFEIIVASFTRHSLNTI